MSVQTKKLPTKISIFGKEILVKRVEMKEGDFGEYHQFKQVIDINKKSDIDEARKTLFHEAIHAALHISGLSQMLVQTDLMDMEEAIVVCLESAFCEVVDVDKLNIK